MLNRKVSITIPGTNHGRPISAAEQVARVDMALSVLSALFGGATAIQAKGGWISETAGLVVESVVLVYSFTDDATLARERLPVLDYARKIAADYGQEAVAVEWPEGMEFVTAESLKEAA